MVRSLLLATVSAAAAASAPAWDTSGMVGAEYTPWRASNELWWHEYKSYRDDVIRELKLTKEVMGFTTLRMFLHSMLHADDAEGLKANVADFLDICEREGFTAGFVFFDDCWAHAGASLSSPCLPKKGLHNGCWMASPQDVERTDVDRFESYVSDIVATFKNDKRVAWWEIFNEPNRNSDFTVNLRHAGFGWAKAQNASQPVISCWDDEDVTEIVDHHQYNLPWGVDNGVFADPAKGGLVTEAGARWYQKTDSDSGSPLTVLNWLTALKKAVPEGPFEEGVDRYDDDMDECGSDGCPNVSVADCKQKCESTEGCVAYVHAPASCDKDHEYEVCWLKQGNGGTVAKNNCRSSQAIAHRPSPFVPGVMIDWEVMVGHSQTRWHWGDAEGIAEPPIPWHNHIFPDGTPVSFTEAAATRRYTTGADDFLFVETFLDVDDPRSDEKYLTLAPANTFNTTGVSAKEALYELTFWPEGDPVFGPKKNAAAMSDKLVLDIKGLQVSIDGEHLRLMDPQHSELASFNVSEVQGGVVMKSWNMLRVLLQHNRVRVWFNPQFSDVTGGSVPADEEFLVAMPPRIDVSTKASAGDLTILTPSSNTGILRVDYVSVLPAKLYGLAAADDAPHSLTV